MYSFWETAMWMVFGGCVGFMAGYAIGFREGRDDGFVRGKIAARKGAK